MDLKTKPSERAFTLLELVTVILIISILAVLLIPVVTSIKAQAARIACTSNLTSLYVGASSYVQDQGHWPQVSTTNIHGPEYAKGWIDALSKYGLSEKNWVCPTVDRVIQQQSRGAELAVRIDYFATPFDNDSRSPYKWTTQPWFAERGDMHGDGNLLIFTDGRVTSLNEVYRNANPQ